MEVLCTHYFPEPQKFPEQYYFFTARLSLTFCLLFLPLSTFESAVVCVESWSAIVTSKVALCFLSTDFSVFYLLTRSLSFYRLCEMSLQALSAVFLLDFLPKSANHFRLVEPFPEACWRVPFLSWGISDSLTFVLWFLAISNGFAFLLNGLFKVSVQAPSPRCLMTSKTRRIPLFASQFFPRYFLYASNISALSFVAVFSYLLKKIILNQSPSDLISF